MLNESKTVLNLSARAAAVIICQGCVETGSSLATLLPRTLDTVPPQQRPLVQELSYGVLRWYYRLDGLLTEMLVKPLRGKKITVHYILLVGLYQLLYLDKPVYAVVKETVNTAVELNQGWAKNLVNAILRRFLREHDQLLEKLSHSWCTLYAYPDWLIAQIKNDCKALGVDPLNVFTAGNQRPPMILRVNQNKQSVQEYRQVLQAVDIGSRILNDENWPHYSLYFQDALLLEKPQSVEHLPGFAAGAVSVQDAAAQLAARILDVQPGDRVLDACAAPGGKTMHILELQPALSELVALDISAQRLQQVEENLQRGGFLPLSADAETAQSKIQLVTADAAEQAWWDGQLYERILLDAPCSATGVIRRHPDIKVLRRAADIATLVILQQNILRNLWEMLKPGGILLYATCSILRVENDLQIARFLQTQTDAEELKIQAEWGREMSPGRQILPGEAQMDGFYYALLIKQPLIHG